MKWLARLLRRFKREDRTLERFREAFGPDVCPICSHHRYGYRMGFEESPRPRPHDGCPEIDGGSNGTN